MRPNLIPSQRLIVAADFKPSPGQGKDWVGSQVLALADRLQGTGVCLKVNAALRACGYGLIQKIRERGLGVFADLKLVDIPETLDTDGKLLQEAMPDLLTVMCAAGRMGLEALKTTLPNTEVLGVTVLTSLKDEDTQEMFGRSTREAVLSLAQVGALARIDGLICAPAEASILRARFGNGFSLNTPGIRPAWATVAGDDQNPERVMTPAKAIRAGADRIVVGRPITQAENPYDAVMRTIAEIVGALSV